MHSRFIHLLALLGAVTTAAYSQTNAPPSQPLYQVTIISRTTKAINYGYLSAPTRIGFQGTALASSAGGKATVEPTRGATLLDINVNGMPPPNRFGPQYLTYVVWAISPDGRAQNVGELILDGSEKGRLRTSTQLQTFALIVTAEPYYAVAQPSEVVVLENIVTSETTGKVQEVNATFELLPRKPYTFDPAKSGTAAGQPVSSQQYESITALYQALNAIQIAQSQGADRHAPDQMARARQLYNKARGYPVHLSKEIVSMAREATQIAEDSRAIAVKRAEAEKAARDEAEAGSTNIQSQTAEQPTESAPVEANPSLTRSRSAAPQPQAAAPVTQGGRAPVEVDPRQFEQQPGAAGNRQRLLAGLPRAYEVLDSTRGVVVTIPGDAVSSQLTRSYFAAIASAIRPYRDLHLKVEAHGSTEASQVAAAQVKQGLISAGVPADIIVVQDYGNTRPRTSNGSPQGRRQNHRVEIVIAGDAIGTVPAWDRTYSLRPDERPRVN